MAKLLSPEEAAEELGVSLVTIFRMFRDGRLKRYRMGTHAWKVYASLDDLAKLKQARPIEPSGARTAKGRAKRSK